MRRVTTALAAAICLSLSPAALVSAAAAADRASAPVETKARQALIVDGETGAVLFEKDAAAPFPPASLAKLMTMEVVFEALEAGKLSLDQTFPVSEHAWRTGGAPSGTSTMFAGLNSSVPLDALIRGTIVQAANDATIIIAEGMAGSEPGFAGLMNEAAKTLGLAGSHFVNPSGLPAEGQSVTARDLVTLARHIEEHHPNFYAIYAEPSFEWNKIFQRNRNPLLAMGIGATGMGTGYTEASGYSLMGVTDRAGRKTFLALGGLDSIKDRTEEARRLLDWSNDTFERAELFAAKTPFGAASVYGGVVSNVPVETHEPIVVYVPKEREDAVKAEFVYDGPLLAPVEAGQKIGRLSILIDGRESLSADLFAATAVEQGTFASRAMGAARELAFGWIRAL
ncbi:MULTISPECIES: D-alanyl-D-alanine carboxypeptidase family protein [unclassified Aureimonas]|uniref:D-alanyl-D-alanine carboxypeptidase family protein n=1 Tax=unclassified Aureimonas TaxID=2615206 RepID=UPI000701817D|nr:MULTISPECIES: D-alanyl-D-alanine carboxypeptidase family protein [unclassified Aureimonas]KQT60351.1 D-alanyl-D-alanine carboxypeptidase [Aureimonas sp. Leaf427]KQT79228.1 D-alanyl-D-alanine carboxypeptidase [Aureimonas sp. Leaf460]